MARSGQGLFISRYTLFRSRREFAKFAEFSSNGSRKRPFRGLPLWTNSAHGRSMRVTQRVNCRFVTRKAVQPTEDAISNTNAPFMRPPRCLRANCLVSSIFHLPRVSSGKAFDLFNPESRPFFFFFFFVTHGNFTRDLGRNIPRTRKLWRIVEKNNNPSRVERSRIDGIRY